MMLLLQDKRQVLNIAAVVALAVILLWPAYVNGEPFYMTDTSSYLRGADAAAHWLTGHRTVWTDELFHRFPASGATKSQTSTHADAPVVLTGRSIYYGFLLYIAQFLGNFWAIAVLQALIVSSSIAITIGILPRRAGGRVIPESTASSTLVVGICLAAFTPMAYFTSYLMPDIFGALGLLAFAHLAFLWKQNSRASRTYWFLLLLGSMLFHTANFMLVGLLTALAAGVALLRIPFPKPTLAPVVGALVLAAIGQALFTWGVERATGAPPIRPPFIAARIIDDGPGADYLQKHCPQAKLIYCRTTSFKSKISDSLLWSQDPKLGIFQALAPSEQRLAAAQQTRFVLSVLADRPVQLLKSSAGAVLRQVGHFDLASFNYTAQNVDYFNHKLPQPFISHARLSKAFRGIMPVGFVETATVGAVLASLLVICWVLGLQLRRSRLVLPEHAWVIALVVGVLLNAAVCGALSTPKGRYQMRLIWVLPFAALVLLPRREGVSAAIFRDPRPAG